MEEPALKQEAMPSPVLAQAEMVAVLSREFERARWLPTAMRAAGLTPVPWWQQWQISCPASCRSRASCWASAHLPWVLLAFCVLRARHTRRVLSGIWCTCYAEDAEKCRKNVPLAYRSCVRGNTPNFVLTACCKLEKAHAILTVSYSARTQTRCLISLLLIPWRRWSCDVWGTPRNRSSPRAPRAPACVGKPVRSYAKISGHAPGVEERSMQALR